MATMPDAVGSDTKPQTTPAAHPGRIRRVRPATAFWLTAVAFTAIMIGTTIPTPLYPGYEARFGFGPLTVTVVFATYAIGVLLALILLGRASDVIGRRPVMFTGIAIAVISSVIFVIAGALSSGGLPLLFAGRVTSGLTAGIFAGTATAAISDFAKPGQQRKASVVAAVANIGGLGLGPLLAGILARYASLPLQTSYLVHIGLLAVATTCVLRIPEPVKKRGLRSLRVQELYVPPEARLVLAQAGTAGFAGFAVLGMFTAVTPAVLGLLDYHNPALTGLVVFAVFAAAVCGQLTAASLANRTSLLTGTSALVVGIGLVGASLWAASLGLLVAGGVVAGAGFGLSFGAALGAVTASSPPDRRSAVASTFFAICYVGISLPVVGIGIGANAYGLVHTGEVFAVIIALLSLTALVSLARTLPAARREQ
jgi:MFS family permease